VSDINKERKNAVREAWKNERAYVREGNGTRDWSQTEQKEIVAKGRANGYEGHHMKSVKDYPQHAGDPKNIQFLNRSEHVDGAHKGNTQNSTNGYYNPSTKTMHSFGNNNPVAPQVKNLSTPISQKDQNLAIKREQARQQASKQAKTEKKQSVSKTTFENTQTSSKQHNTQTPVPSSNNGIESLRNQSTRIKSANTQSNQNKGIEAARKKSVGKPTGTSTSQNKGIASYQSKMNGQSSSSGSTNAKSSGSSQSR